LEVELAEVQTAVESHRHASVDLGVLRASAVLVLLHDGPMGPEVLLTKRSAEMRNHRGEMSFPGGRVDGEETFEQAALREAQEEVGLAADAVQLLGRLDPLVTVVSNSYIQPVVAVAAERPAAAPASPEVDRVMWVKLAELLAPDTFREEVWTLPFGVRPIYFFELADETVWGATARVLHQLLCLATGVAATPADAW
jgi:8-oxo-dGTP pyrophosphatase MutT (NUDIX family)